MTAVNLEAEHEIERAISYLINNFEETGHNPKPVIFHSLRVGIRLWDLGYGSLITIAGILHDVLEDTEVTEEALAAEFSDEVHRLVAANSHDRSIEGREGWYKEVFQRCYEEGKEALIVKAADFYDNLDYYGMGWRKQFTVHELRKAKYFIELSAGRIGNERVHADLKAKYDTLLDTKFSDLRLALDEASDH